MKPVYMINGFLDSGKTEFIRYTLEQPYFQVKGKTLLILCEDGENEYPQELLSKTKTILERVENEEDLTPAAMMELEKKYKPERIIIEYNGMWNYRNFKMPWHWTLEQQITCIDCSTFAMYFTNMRSLLAEMVKKSELIIFNRCDGMEEQLPGYKRNIKAVNAKADIVFEDKDGEINSMFEDDLPYQLTDDPIVLDDQGYGIFYIDAMDHPERYEGKRLRFLAQVMNLQGLEGRYFLPGRAIMTCCADDVQFLGYAAKYEKKLGLEDRTWIRVTAEFHAEYFEGYEGKGPVLHVQDIEVAKAPKEEVISFM